MEKAMDRLLKKRAQGDSSFVATLICMFAMVTLFVALFYAYAQNVNQNKVERVYRQYLFRMEREGYLTPTDKAGLLADLTALGLKNIDLTGTSFSAVGYGNEVRLVIKGDLEVDAIKFGTGGDPSKAREEIHIEVEKTGTALY
jgi:hypothetical protein